jgi:hypothetical protein
VTPIGCLVVVVVDVVDDVTRNTQKTLYINKDGSWLDPHPVKRHNTHIGRFDFFASPPLPPDQFPNTLKNVICHDDGIE